MIFLYFALHDVACYAAAVYLIENNSPYWAGGFVALAATTAIRWREGTKDTNSVKKRKWRTVNMWTAI